MACVLPGRAAPPSTAAEAAVAQARRGGLASAAPTALPGGDPAGLPAAGGAGQWLLRAEISGEEGAGSLRILLLRLGPDRFALSAADALGQARWEIRRDQEAAIWLDPQGHRFCHLAAALPLRAALWVAAIPLADLPGLLTGEWPPEAAASSSAQPAGEGDSQVTGERDEGGWRSWTLWQGGEPVVWWQRVGPDSLLSLRRPAVQVRFRVTARSPLDSSAGRPARPAWGASAADLSAAEFLLPGELREGLREVSCPDNAIP